MTIVGTPESNKPYECFTVHAMKDDNRNGIRVPWKGIEQTMSHVRELLEQGYMVQITPYTKEQWAEKSC